MTIHRYGHIAMMAIALAAVSWTVYAHGDWKAPSKAAGRKNPVVRDEASLVNFIQSLKP
jgi:hypothetical protein